MKKRLAVSIASILSMFFSGIAPADDAMAPPPNYVSMRDVQDERQFIQRIWDGDGIVIVGQLEIPTDASISTRIPIYEDGSYCTALYRGRKLTFFAHGYDPLEVPHFSQIATNVYDAGTQHFARAKPEDMRTLRGSVTTSGGETATIMDCTLQIRNHEYLWQDHGNRCGAPITVTVDSTTLDSGMPFVYNNLSRLPYVLVITAPGYIKKEIKIDQKLDDVIDLGKITLAPALSYRITYRARVRQDGGKWIGENETQTSTISCDGDSEFLFSKQRDGLGNSLELRMRPNEKGVEASFFYYQGNSFHELGQMSSSALPTWDSVDTAILKSDSRVLLEDGHAYYFTIEDINGTDIQMVFQIERQ